MREHVMKWKYAICELWKHPIMVLLIFIQTVVVFVVLISMVSVIMSRYSRYHEVEKLLSGNGMVGNVMNLQHTDASDLVQTAEQARECLPHGTVAACYKWAYEIEGDEQPIVMTGYDDALWKCHTPSLADGRWFRDSDVESEELEVVIAQKGGAQGKYRVGDSLYMKADMISEMMEDGEEDYEGEHQIALKVVGVIRDGAAILGKGNAAPDTEDYRTLFWNYSGSFEESMYIFGLQDELFRYKMAKAPGWFTIMSGLSFLSWNTEDSEQISENEEYVMTQGLVLSSDNYEKIKNNSISYIFEQVKTLLPVLVTLVIMTILSTACNMAIMLRQGMRHYAVYYINGLSWRECFGLHIRAVCFLEIGILLITFLGIGICRLAGVLKNTVIYIGPWQILCSVCMCLLFGLMSLLVAAGQIRGRTAKDVLREDSVD
ncbi:MAG: hypothetical protein J1E62_04075 [Lachnospiraceae bacterium]|nr:hypothetical protein [Lachnospiraceae bacterium]